MTQTDTRPTAPSSSATSAWLLLIYKVPSEPSRLRVAVWRELKRLGAHYLQQAVCLLPDTARARDGLASMRERVIGLGGTAVLGALTLSDDDSAQVSAAFVANAQRDYAEIVEECQTKFVKEIEFERFRENYTFEEAEEIRQDLDKLKRWLAQVVERDWLGAPGRQAAEGHIADCEKLLEAFEADVFQRTVPFDPGPVVHVGVTPG